MTFVIWNLLSNICHLAMKGGGEPRSQALSQSLYLNACKPCKSLDIIYIYIYIIYTWRQSIYRIRFAVENPVWQRIRILFAEHLRLMCVMCSMNNDNDTDTDYDYDTDIF